MIKNDLAFVYVAHHFFVDVICLIDCLGCEYETSSVPLEFGCNSNDEVKSVLLKQGKTNNSMLIVDVE